MKRCVLGLKCWPPHQPFLINPLSSTALEGLHFRAALNTFPPWGSFLQHPHLFREIRLISACLCWDLASSRSPSIGESAFPHTWCLWQDAYFSRVVSFVQHILRFWDLSSEHSWVVFLGSALEGRWTEPGAGGGGGLRGRSNCSHRGSHRTPWSVGSLESYPEWDKVGPLFPSINQALDMSFSLKKHGLGSALFNQVPLLGGERGSLAVSCQLSTLSGAGNVFISVRWLGCGAIWVVRGSFSHRQWPLFCRTEFSYSSNHWHTLALSPTRTLLSYAF